MRIQFILVALLCLSLNSLSAQKNKAVQKPSPANAAYTELVALFKTWRAFEEPPLRNGAPDYTAATFDQRWPAFEKLRAQLLAIDTTNWSIAQKADWRIILAEMNGY
ncbi:MAG: hypothetical protein AAGJ93_17700, partial [Bacteroidota bacterium]